MFLTLLIRDFVFCVCVLFSIRDVDAVIDADSG